eukprot:264200-Chlamydomonas_euryale.AAC.2
MRHQGGRKREDAIGGRERKEAIGERHWAGGGFGWRLTRRAEGGVAAGWGPAVRVHVVSCAAFWQDRRSAYALRSAAAALSHPHYLAHATYPAPPTPHHLTRTT